MEKLTSQYLRTILEYKDGELYWKVSKKNKIKIGDIVAPTRTQNRHIRVGINGKQYQLHRIIYLYFNENFDIEDRRIQIDHIDLNIYNNKIENLRIVTNQENNFNKTLLKNNTSGFRGVEYRPEHYRKKPWRESYRLNGKYYSKFFLTQKEAIEFAENKRKEHHGEFYRKMEYL